MPKILHKISRKIVKNKNKIVVKAEDMRYKPRHKLKATKVFSSKKEYKRIKKVKY